MNLLHSKINKVPQECSDPFLMFLPYCVVTLAHSVNLTIPSGSLISVHPLPPPPDCRKERWTALWEAVDAAPTTLIEPGRCICCVFTMADLKSQTINLPPQGRKDGGRDWKKRVRRGSLSRVPLSAGGCLWDTGNQLIPSNILLFWWISVSGKNGCFKLKWTENTVKNSGSEERARKMDDPS